MTTHTITKTHTGAIPGTPSPTAGSSRWSPGSTLGCMCTQTRSPTCAPSSRRAGIGTRSRCPSQAGSTCHQGIPCSGSHPRLGTSGPPCKTANHHAGQIELFFFLGWTPPLPPHARQIVSPGDSHKSRGFSNVVILKLLKCFRVLK